MAKRGRPKLQNPNTTKIGLWVSADLDVRLKAVCRLIDRTRGEVAREGIERILADILSTLSHKEFEKYQLLCTELEYERFLQEQERIIREKEKEY